MHQIQRPNPSFYSIVRSFDFSAFDRTHFSAFENYTTREYIELALVAIYAFVTILEWRTFDSERKTSENEFLASQTNAARQLDEIRKDRTLDQRAWVAPFEMEAEAGTIQTNTTFFILKFKNTGKTPALRFSEAHHYAYGVNSVPTNDPDIPPASLMIAPDGVCWIRVGPISPEEIAAIKSGYTVPLCVFGKFTYDDIFGNHHWTRFCWGVDAGLSSNPIGAYNSCDDAQETGGK